MKHEVLIGQQDYTVLVFIPDSAQTDGSGKTGLVAANLTVSYVRVETDNDVVVTDVTGSLNNLAALTTAHTDWGLLEVSSTLAPGLYRLDIADAVFAAGAWSAVVYVMVTTSAAAASPMEFVMVPNSPLTGVLLAPVTHTSAVIPTVTTTGTATAVTTVNGLAANVITAAATASDFGTEVASAVWDMDATGHQTTGTFGQAIGDPAADTNTIYGAVVTGAAGATVAADIIAIKTETATILADTNDIQTRLPAALTAGGVMKTEALYAGGAVWIDTGGGAAGTTNYTHGTVTNPNSSIANARTIADALNLNIFNVSNGSSVTLDQGYTNYQFIGERWSLALASRAITGTHFQGAIVSGLSTGTDTEWDDCDVGTVTIANGSTFHSCGMSGTFTCQAAGVFNFIGCASNTAAGVDWILDFGALGATTIALRDWRGAVEVRNMAAGDVLAITGAGRVTLAASCTAGTVQIAGLINFINNGSGQTISDGARWNEDQRLANVTLVDTTTNLTNGVLLSNGAHGGADAVLTLKQLALNNADAGGVAVRIQGTGAGNSHGIHVSSTNGKAVALDAASNAMTIDSSAANGLVVTGVTGDIVGDITGVLSQVTLCDTTTTNTDMLTAAAVNAEVVDALNVDTYAEIGQETPAATQTIRKMLAYLYKSWRNKSDQTATTYRLYNDDGTTVAQKSTVSDDATTFTSGEKITGP